MESSFLTSVSDSGDVIWGATLAAIDSDDDGFTNGQELGDEEGIWIEGSEDSGQPPTAPGDPGSLPAYLGEWSAFGVLDVIDPQRGIGFAAYRVIVEGDIVAQDGSLLTLADIPDDQYLVVQGEVGRDQQTVFASLVALENPGEGQIGLATLEGVFRHVDNGEIVVGEFTRGLLTNADLRDGPGGPALTIDDYQLGDLVEYTISIYSIGDFVTRLIRNPDTGGDPIASDEDVQLAFLDDDGLLWIRGPAFDASNTDFFDDTGAPIDPVSISPRVRIAVGFEDPSGSGLQRAIRVDVLSEDDPNPGDPDILLQRFDGIYDGSAMRTYEPFPQKLARDADLVFGDGSAAARSDLFEIPVRLVVQPPRVGGIFIGHVVTAVTVDPPDYNGPGAPPPQPTEFFSEEVRHDFVEQVNVDLGEIRLGGARVVVEGDVVDGDGNPIGVEGLSPGDRIVVEATPSVDLNLFFADMIQRDPPDDLSLEPNTGFFTEVRWVDGNEIGVGEGWHRLLSDADYDDFDSGQSLTLADFQSGGLVEYVVAQTDVGEIVISITRNPDFDPGPHLHVYDNEIAFIDDKNRVWDVGNTFQLDPGASVIDIDGSAIDVNSIGDRAWIAVGWSTDDDQLAISVEVLPVDMGSGDPNIGLFRFDRVNADQLFTYAPYPRYLAREAQIELDDGTAATIADVPPGRARLHVVEPGYNFPHLGEFVERLIIDPVDFGTGGEPPPQPTEFFSEEVRHDFVEQVNVDLGEIRLGGARVVVEGDVVDGDGNPIGVEGLSPGDRIVVEAIPSVDVNLFFADMIQRDPPDDLSLEPNTGFFTEVRWVDGNEIGVGEGWHRLLSDADYDDFDSGQSLTLADFQSGGLVEYVVAQTDVGEIVISITRNPDFDPGPHLHVYDNEIAFIDDKNRVWDVGNTFQLDPGASVIDVDGSAIDMTSIDDRAWIAVGWSTDDDQLAISVEVLPVDMGSGDPNIGLFRFDRVNADQLFTYAPYPRYLAREAQIELDDGTTATIADVPPGRARLHVVEPGYNFPHLGEFVERLIIDPVDTPSLDDWLADGDDLDGNGSVGEIDYHVFLWLAGPEVADLNGDGFNDFADFEAHLLGAGASDDGVVGDSPIAIDFDPAQGDQQVHIARNARPGREYVLQLHVTGAPPVQGWSATLSYDPQQLTYVQESFETSAFIDGGLQLVRSEPGEIGVGTTVLLGDAAGDGDAMVGSLQLVVLDDFSGSADIEIVRYGFHLVGGEQLFELVNSVVTISAEVTGDLPADFDGNGIVDLDDFRLFADGFGSDDVTYDLNDDGFVNFQDLFVFADVFGQRLPAFKLLALAHELLGLPTEPELGPNYPNPFNASTTIPLLLPRPGHVDLEIYDVLGQRVRQLVNTTLPAGVHPTAWDGRDDAGRPVAGGVYFIRLEATPEMGPGQVRIRKLMLTE